ncbi:TSC22 domain family protein 2 TSC22-related-inducible leucine zipper protein 4 [Triplophysa tibetana]|uniref:TSC22 domain family protein 2 TSC22-related-inducible leucine zipper protein 4 n=1 Tax=Triplophysa tibetana TaxID=1572043 RepID=A0A5A9NRW9_9TELE|nr:TSC22 domain family protein 2 TSC22-related-inducible leucine zipper protein 4 [Triplophysa tibetana]
MSKMLSKKKSCFQITSVTQAQVATNSITDDTESLDDPESRTEDMSSSEIYDISKSGDFEAETCDVSLYDEPLHNDSETSGASLSLVHDGLTTPGSRNTGAIHMNPNVRGVLGQMGTAAGSSQHSPTVTASVAQASTSVSSSATVSSCSSRFRVIKLDHSTEPFKRGRWTCSEFYEKETDVSSSSRTVDNVKHAGTLDHNADKDGHGNPGVSVASPAVLSLPAAEPHTDSGYASNPSIELQHQSYGISQQGIGLATHSFYPVGTGGAHIHRAKSPSMPSTTQPQPIYQGKQAQNPSNTLASHQPDFRSQHPLDGSSLTSPPLGVPLNRGLSPVMTPALGGSHGLGLVSQSVDAKGHGRGPEHVQGLLQQPGIGGALGTVSVPSVVPQASVPLIQPAVAVSVTPHNLVPGVQNVPVVMSSASNTAPSMPNQTPVPAAHPQQNQLQGMPSGLVVGLGAPFSFSRIPTGITQAEDNQRMSESLPRSSFIIGKDGTKTLNAHGLQLSTPAVNSLFGISIPIDGDEDRNPSTAFYQAFSNCRSKVISNGASGASVVAIDNKIEQAMDLVKSHLMYAVREEVEVLKEQIKELYERNSVLERENAVLKSLANSEQLTPFNNPRSTSPQQTEVNDILQEGSKLVALPPQPNVSTA